MKACAGNAAVATVVTNPRVVLFDFDGVLMRGDAFSRFVRSRFRRSWWRMLLALIALPLLLPFYAVRSLRMPIIGVFVRISLLGTSPQRFELLVREFAGELVAKPRIFIAGADLKVLASARGEELRKLIVLGQQTFQKLKKNF